MAQTDDLTTYPRPNVAVDVAVLTVLQMAHDGVGPMGQLAVLLQDRAHAPRGQALPGRFLRERQTLAAAVEDVLRLKVGLAVSVPAPRLLRVFDDPRRDERAWTISLAHALALPHDQVLHAAGEFVAIDTDGSLTSGDTLLFDHDTIVREAAAEMRERYEHRPDPDGLLDGPFTLAELRALHEGVLGQRLLKDTFNRRMVDHLEPVLDGRKPRTRTGTGRPAQLYNRASDTQPSPSDRRRLLLPRESD